MISLLGSASGLGGLVLFDGLFLLFTAVWHAIAGTSWLSPLLPWRRKQGLIGIPVSLVLVVGGASLVPASATSTANPSEVQGSTTASAQQTTTSGSPVPTPSASAVLDATTAPSTVAAGSSAVAVLATIAVKGRAPMTGYSRDQFGQAWYDLDRNGCDTRNDILRRDLVGITLAGTYDCVVLTGTLQGPYTGKTISFVRSETTSTTVEIDHVVALGDAWQTGAQQLSAGQRLALANDPLNLLAVDGPTNLAKGDGDAATWLPPNKVFRCAYAARQTAVKAAYSLWMTQAEHDAVAGILATCPDETVPSPTVRPVVTTPTTSAPTQAATTTAPAAPKPVTTTTAPKPVTYQTFANCTDMHRTYPHGVARVGGVDLVKGKPRSPQPAYYVSTELYDANSSMDGDHDGVACESA